MKELIIAFCFLCLFENAYSLNEKLTVKFGKVTTAEFNINAFQGDTTVPAIVLCDYVEITVTNRTFYKRHIRIKINSEKGMEYAKFELPYQFKEKHDDIIIFKGNSFLLENENIIKYRYSNSNSRTEEIDPKNRKKVLELPGVKPGMIVEFYYEIASLDFIKLDDWYFQREIPTLWSEIRLDVPNPFFYLMTFQNGEFLNTDEQLKYAEKLQWLYNANRFQRRNKLAESKNVLFESATGKYRVYVINNMKKKIVMKNLPGVSSVSQYISVNDYYPKLRFDLFESSGNLPWFYRPLLLTTVAGYDGKSRRELMHSSNELTGYVHYRLDTWMDFNEELLKSERFGMQLIKHFEFKPILDKIITDGMDQRDKMETVFKYLQENMIWNGHYSMYVDNGLKAPFEKGEGSSSEINMLLIYLLRRADLKVDPVLLRTNNLGLPETIFPVHNQFNHVIAMVNIDNDIFLLDAIIKDKPLAELPYLDLNTSGWRVNNKDFGWIEIGL